MIWDIKLGIFSAMGRRLVCVSEEQTINWCLTPTWKIQKKREGRKGVKERWLNWSDLMTEQTMGWQRKVSERCARWVMGQKSSKSFSGKLCLNVSSVTNDVQRSEGADVRLAYIMPHRTTQRDSKSSWMKKEITSVTNKILSEWSTELGVEVSSLMESMRVLRKESISSKH